MDSKILDTQFAPAERTPSEKLERQKSFFKNETLVKEIVDATPVFLLVLNEQREIVFTNQTFLDYLGAKDLNNVCGLRPGEAINCLHGFETEGGCGTTEFCKTCGAVKAILSAQKGSSDIQECRIIQKDEGGALDLRVWATPFKFKDENFTLFYVSDISHEKRRAALERIFFHDILNSAGGVYGFSELMLDSDPEELEELAAMVNQYTGNLIDEIKAQRELAAAENGELVITKSQINPSELLKGTCELYKNHEVAKERNLTVVNPDTEKSINTDKRLLRRILGNMTKNALEASKPNQTVTLSYHIKDAEIEFSVHNPTYMPRRVQLQVFQRSFSTKGGGRGLGTYSMKLLSEKFLQGRVSFSSTEDEGTTFKATFPIN